MFSKLAQVPVPTLRYYDQIGLLRPSETDRATGYRYYAAEQLPRLHRILALKGLGFSLEQIGATLDEGLTPQQLRGMLRLRHAQISQQLAEMRDQLVDVEVRLRQIEGGRRGDGYEVLVKRVEPLLVASIRAIHPHHGAVGDLFGEVYAALGPHVGEALGPHPGEAGQTLVLWYDDEFRERDFDGAAAFVLRRPVPERGRMRVQTLPAATMAATLHHGSYNRIGDAHRAVLGWIDANGYRIAGPDREVYLYNAMPIDPDDPSYITEIQYPIEKGPGDP